MILSRFFRRRDPARELALIGVAKRRATVAAVARQIREELGLPESEAHMTAGTIRRDAWGC
jgi:hypothetical protein